jgi:hypothetical protein
MGGPQNSGERGRQDAVVNSGHGSALLRAQSRQNRNRYARRKGR